MLTVNGVETETPPTGLTPTQQDAFHYAVHGRCEFFLPSSARLPGFLNALAEIKANAPAKLGQDYDVYRRRVSAAAVGAVSRSAAEWSIDLTITTAAGPVTVPIFVSSKRHLVSSFAFSQMVPRPARQDSDSGEPRNSVVRDDGLFEELLRRYARAQADALVANQMMFLYDPRAVNALSGGRQAATGFVHDERILIESDTSCMPNDSFSHRPNGIHCYPAGFAATPTQSLSTEVLQLDAKAYDALVQLLLLVGGTDQYGHLRVPYPSLKRFASHDAVSMNSYHRRLGEYEKALQGGLDKVRQGTGLHDRMPGLAEAVAKTIPKRGPLHAPLGAAVEAMRDMLVELGKLAAVPTDTGFVPSAGEVKATLGLLTDQQIEWTLGLKSGEGAKLRQEVAQLATNESGVKAAKIRADEANRAVLKDLKNQDGPALVDTLKALYAKLDDFYTANGSRPRPS